MAHPPLAPRPIQDGRHRRAHKPMTITYDDYHHGRIQSWCSSRHPPESGTHSSGHWRHGSRAEHGWSHDACPRALHGNHLQESLMLRPRGASRLHRRAHHQPPDKGAPKWRRPPPIPSAPCSRSNATFATFRSPAPCSPLKKLIGCLSGSSPKPPSNGCTSAKFFKPTF